MSRSKYQYPRARLRIERNTTGLHFPPRFLKAPATLSKQLHCLLHLARHRKQHPTTIPRPRNSIPLARRQPRHLVVILPPHQRRRPQRLPRLRALRRHHDHGDRQHRQRRGHVRRVLERRHRGEGVAAEDRAPDGRAEADGDGGGAEDLRRVGEALGVGAGVEDAEGEEEDVEEEFDGEEETDREEVAAGAFCHGVERVGADEELDGLAGGEEAKIEAGDEENAVVDRDELGKAAENEAGDEHGDEHGG
mmetsp:Transcript_11885/g.30002  ORF Transcript_11885/g.30002 Transcript_11885/m.30002 type:complete len:249 (+) Transcript_11885:758-1504(+)